MCGISGFLKGSAASADDAAQAILRRMCRVLDHRGPDHNAIWNDPAAGIALGHNRLAIVELSAAGNQPMASPDGHLILVYNGEIYNHNSLRDQLEQSGVAPAWRGLSDTETLLAGFATWGVAETLKKATGMFALALWDREKRSLVLARDRLGEKPLYFGWQGSGSARSFLFGSELKALAAHPAFAGEVDRDALSQFLRFAYVPAPRSIYRGIGKLAPGCFAVLRDGADQPEVTAYWSAGEAIAAGRASPFAGSPEDAVDALEKLLSDAVRQQMMADVPLGAFLSGGVDSSVIVALMQAQSARPVKTFTIGFAEEAYNEAAHAKAVARHLGTDHTELYISPGDALAVIPSLPLVYDEPFADVSQIPTLLVSQLARRDVTVSLSGDAGDELFAGYNRYAMASRLWGRLSQVPTLARRAAAGAISSVSPATWNWIGRRIGPALPGIGPMANLGHKMHKGAGVLASSSTAELYRGMVSHWLSPDHLVIGAREPTVAALEEASWPAALDPIERMMAADLVTYLPDDILVKVDRAAMAHSLETRVPMLNHHVVEFAWSLPIDYKLRDGHSKWVLREVLNRHVPHALIDRPKMGFGVPIDSWLRGSLRDWAEALIDEGRLRREGFLDPAPIRRMWDLHQSGRADVQYQLWDVLMFQAWLDRDAAGMAGKAHFECTELAVA